MIRDSFLCLFYIYADTYIIIYLYTHCIYAHFYTHTPLCPSRQTPDHDRSGYRHREQIKAAGAELAELLIFHQKKKKQPHTLKIENSLMINSAVVKFKAYHFTELLDVEIITATLLY